MSIENIWEFLAKKQFLGCHQMMSQVFKHHRGGNVFSCGYAQLNRDWSWSKKWFWIYSLQDCSLFYYIVNFSLLLYSHLLTIFFLKTVFCVFMCNLFCPMDANWKGTPLKSPCNSLQKKLHCQFIEILLRYNKNSKGLIGYEDILTWKNGNIWYPRKN